MNPSFIPFSYLNPDLGHHGPYVDGLLVAREIVKDAVFETLEEEVRALRDIDKAIEQGKILYHRNK